MTFCKTRLLQISTIVINFLIPDEIVCFFLFFLFIYVFIEFETLFIVAPIPVSSDFLYSAMLGEREKKCLRFEMIKQVKRADFGFKTYYR